MDMMLRHVYRIGALTFGLLLLLGVLIAIYNGSSLTRIIILLGLASIALWQGLKRG